jgi:hypothetical protein
MQWSRETMCVTCALRAQYFDGTIGKAGASMVSQNLNRVLEAAQCLNDEERQELRRLLGERATCQSQPTKEQQLDQLLRERGVVRTVPPKPTAEAVGRFKAWRPIEMPGGSLSDELIRERR